MRQSIALFAVLVLATGVLAQERRPGFDAIRRSFDKDGDGKVTSAEFDRGRARFRFLDKNKDGVLTEDDFGTNSAKPKAEEPTTSTPPIAKPSEATPEQFADFEKEIRPLLIKHCYSCHSEESVKVRGGLKLDTRESTLTGGASGPAIVPGDLEQSLLIRAVRYDEDLRMPPKAKLPKEAIDALEAWVRMGAPDPRIGGSASPKTPVEPGTPHALMKRDIDIEAGKKWWSYTAPTTPPLPEVKNSEWAWSELDRFLLAEMEERGLAPVGDADKRTWLRRVTFDLTGLAPTAPEIAAFDADNSADAHEKVIDRLLASPAYGERFGRHWLDVARYAESSGKETNIVYPHAWRYRDYVIDAFNQDKPYDVFLKEQLAGDLLPSRNADERAEFLTATGFLALGAKSQNSRDRRQYQMDVVDEQIDATTQAMLGVTVACARCHDHKYDPIPTEDYYALAGIFMSTETRYGTLRSLGNNHPSSLNALPQDANIAVGPKMPPEQRQVIQRLRERAEATVDAGGVRPGAKPSGDPAATPDKNDPTTRVRVRAARNQVEIFDDVLSRFDSNGNPNEKNRVAMGVKEGARSRDAQVLARGEVDHPVNTVKRGFVQVLSDATTPAIKSGSGRKELAEWIASEKNPLTARVMVNRIWLHLFGAGLVPTPDNFGMSGTAPTHPELLDWLATTFAENGWSVKSLIKEITLSHAYRLSSRFDEKNARTDPDVTYLWRMPKRRLEGEAIRDAMLQAAGTLDTNRPAGSPIGTLEGRVQGDQLMNAFNRPSNSRSVYLPIMRDRVPEALEVFDFAEPSFVTGDREETNVATQALYLMNNAIVLEAAKDMARRLLAKDSTEDEKIQEAFVLGFARKPSANEMEAVRSFLRNYKPSPAESKTPERGGRGRRDRRGALRDDRPASNGDTKTAAFAAFCQSLFASAEFRFID